MVSSPIPLTCDRVLIDICTQRDYLERDAVMEVANLDALMPNLHAVFDWARRSRFPVVSLLEAHRPGEPANGSPMHCVDGSEGQKKLDFTFVEPWLLIEADNSLALPLGLHEQYRQLIFRKRGHDVLGNPKADRYLTQMVAEEFVLFGIGMEKPIRSLALALLARHKKVTVITDACGFWSEADADLVSRQLEAKTIRLTTTEEITAPPAAPPPRSVRRSSRRSRSRHHPAKGRASTRSNSRPIRR